MPLENKDTNDDVSERPLRRSRRASSVQPAVAEPSPSRSKRSSIAADAVSKKSTVGTKTVKSTEVEVVSTRRSTRRSSVERTPSPVRKSTATNLKTIPEKETAQGSVSTPTRKVSSVTPRRSTRATSAEKSPPVSRKSLATNLERIPEKTETNQTLRGGRSSITVASGSTPTRVTRRNATALAIDEDSVAASPSRATRSKVVVFGEASDGLENTPSKRKNSGEVTPSLIEKKTIPNGTPPIQTRSPHLAIHSSPNASPDRHANCVKRQLTPSKGLESTSSPSKRKSSGQATPLVEKKAIPNITPPAQTRTPRLAVRSSPSASPDRHANCIKIESTPSPLAAGKSAIWRTSHSPQTTPRRLSMGSPKNLETGGGGTPGGTVLVHSALERVRECHSPLAIDSTPPPEQSTASSYNDPEPINKSENASTAKAHDSSRLETPVKVDDEMNVLEATVPQKSPNQNVSCASSGAKSSLVENESSITETIVSSLVENSHNTGDSGNNDFERNESTVELQQRLSLVKNLDSTIVSNPLHESPTMACNDSFPSLNASSIVDDDFEEENEPQISHQKLMHDAESPQQLSSGKLNEEIVEKTSDPSVSTLSPTARDSPQCTSDKIISQASPRMVQKIAIDQEECSGESIVKSNDDCGSNNNSTLKKCAIPEASKKNNFLPNHYDHYIEGSMVEGNVLKSSVSSPVVANVKLSTISQDSSVPPENGLLPSDSLEITKSDTPSKIPLFSARRSTSKVSPLVEKRTNNGGGSKFSPSVNSRSDASGKLDDSDLLDETVVITEESITKDNGNDSSATVNPAEDIEVNVHCSSQNDTEIMLGSSCSVDLVENESDIGSLELAAPENYPNTAPESIQQFISSPVVTDQISNITINEHKASTLSLTVEEYGNSKTCLGNGDGHFDQKMKLAKRRSEEPVASIGSKISPLKKTKASDVEAEKSCTVVGNVEQLDVNDEEGILSSHVEIVETTASIVSVGENHSVMGRASSGGASVTNGNVSASSETNFNLTLDENDETSIGKVVQISTHEDNESSAEINDAIDVAVEGEHNVAAEVAVAVSEAAAEVAVVDNEAAAEVAVADSEDAAADKGSNDVGIDDDGDEEINSAGIEETDLNATCKVKGIIIDGEPGYDLVSQKQLAEDSEEDRDWNPDLEVTDASSTDGTSTSDSSLETFNVMDFFDLEAEEGEENDDWEPDSEEFDSSETEPSDSESSDVGESTDLSDDIEEVEDTLPTAQNSKEGRSKVGSIAASLKLCSNDRSSPKVVNSGSGPFSVADLNYVSKSKKPTVYASTAAKGFVAEEIITKPPQSGSSGKQIRKKKSAKDVEPIRKRSNSESESALQSKKTKMPKGYTLVLCNIPKTVTDGELRVALLNAGAANGLLSIRRWANTDQFENAFVSYDSTTNQQKAEDCTFSLCNQQLYFIPYEGTEPSTPSPKTAVVSTNRNTSKARYLGRLKKLSPGVTVDDILAAFKAQQIELGLEQLVLKTDEQNCVSLKLVFAKRADLKRALAAAKKVRINGKKISMTRCSRI